jgi:hypothetical protein
MALFVEVQSVDKNCPVIINLDHVIEIAPLTAGGCALFMTDPAGVNAKASIRVKDDYDLFKQFAMQTVTPEDIARRFPKAEAPAKTKKGSLAADTQEYNIPKL